jgi:peptide chain release factor 3
MSTAAIPQSRIEKEVARRRTFAIISHPDAGKTTLTEKLLLYGGAIHLAGAVKAKKNQKNTTSDWMELEKQRGISISTSVLQFDYQGNQINLLDTPGHKDFSEDTYRTLTAADAAVMLIDAAKGVEPQTRKLFEVCRMRGLPIFTFINKLDRPSQDPLDLIDELEKVLGIRSCPMSWPIGLGDRFRGVYDRLSNEVLFFQTEGTANQSGRLEPKRIDANDPEFWKILGGPRNDLDEAKELYETFKSEMELVEFAGDAFDHQQVLAGKLTPVFFGSAMNNFGVERFLQRFIEFAPTPVPRIAVFPAKGDGEPEKAAIEPTSDQYSGFIFKIQANMDPMHRDRVAFMRVCSGRFERNMEVTHARLEKKVRLSKPLHFFAQERVIIDEAWPGDIVGMLDTTGELRIGDTLCTGSNQPNAPQRIFEYQGVPRFSPEHFAQLVIKDPMKRKQLQKGLEQLSEEGVVQIYRQRGMGDKDPVLGAVGALQFEVLQHRLQGEYGVDTKIEKLPFIHARWVVGTGLNPDEFDRREDTRCLEDRDGQPVVLFKSDWGLRWATDNHKSLQFVTTAPEIRGTRKK